ncbi:aminotransferase class IV [Psychroflexus planctonicus]|uniref:branched-chain-amino-acid transaminase n=1 Tax=Psychroflexus planctonicus TaxID=1526575 RepID=A0ABQ1SKK2_9FLAO|nr:aminotransferase class IV [Psychroflexus planctonicus]GGE41237.1 aminotransferase class IV [Psychroflexus planctonicus]
MIHLNGELVEEKSAKLSILNRGFQYGDALFESIRVINNQIMFWETHYFRLMSSMRILRMEIPDFFSPEKLAELIHDVVEANNYLSQAVKVKINVYRDGKGLYLPDSKHVGYIISASPISSPFFIKSNSYCEVELFKDHYLNSGLLSTLKTNNKLTQILASIFAKENGYDNCLMLNENKSVVEATNGNLFLLKNNKLKTPPLSDGCLNGIIRKQLVEIVGELDEYEIEEASISPFELQKADELFYTNAIQGIVSINKYRKKEFNTEFSTQLIGKLNARARLSD